MVISQFFNNTCVSTFGAHYLPYIMFALFLAVSTIARADAPTATTTTVTTPTTSTTALPSLEPVIKDIPSTYTFRSSCITKSYKDSVHGDLSEPTLVKNTDDGTYTLSVTCKNGYGYPVSATINLTLAIYNFDGRIISVRSRVKGKLKNCADIANADGKLICIPATKPATK